MGCQDHIVGSKGVLLVLVPASECHPYEEMFCKLLTIAVLEDSRFHALTYC